MKKAKTKPVVVPKFASEAKEAAWWDAHRSEIDADIRRRMNLGKPLTLGSLLQGRTPSQPVTLRVSREDLQTARRLASRKGLGYQTYMKMLLREALVENGSEGVVNDFCSCVEVDTGFRYWSKLGSLSEETQAAIGESEIVLVPAEGYGDHAGPVFQVGTNELFQFLRSNAPSGINVELASEDANYAELALHGDILRLSSVLVSFLGAPVAIGLILDYLKKRFGSRLADTEVRASVILDPKNDLDHKTVKISYEGPARTFGEAMTEALSRLSKAQPFRAEHGEGKTYSPAGRRK